MELFLHGLTFSKHSAVQILFVPERHHWVATAYRDGEVLLYDSLFPGKLMPSTEDQLVQVYQPAIRGDVLKVANCGASAAAGWGY